jgi:hypothetical protein
MEKNKSKKEIDKATTCGLFDWRPGNNAINFTYIEKKVLFSLQIEELKAVVLNIWHVNDL